MLCFALLGAAGCKSGGGSKESGSTSKSGSGANDINTTDRSDLAEGGKLTWPLDTYPPNFNYNELDGALGDNASVISALLPGMFNVDAAAQLVVNADFATSAELTTTEPKQVVTYKLNPKAVWEDGTPIGLADFEAQWKALSGKDPAYHIVSSNGYERIESVAKGADDHEIVVTFAQPFVDWQGLFSPLYPASTNNDPAVFNDGWKDKILTTAGPFKAAAIDPTGKTIRLVRNDKWWGRRALLDEIVYRQLDRDAQPDALANGEIDFIGIGSSVDRLRRAEGISGIALRHSSSPTFNHLTINGQSPVMSDLNVRKALAQSIDRDAIAKTLLGPLGVKPTPLSNHLYMTNQEGYEDNSKDLPFDPDAAGKLLDAAGWKLEGGGGIRVKDNKQLVMRLPLVPTSTIGKQVAELCRNMAEKVGIKIDIVSVTGDDFFPEYVSKGNFDIVLFAWQGGVFPVTSTKSIYATPKQLPDGSQDVQQNYARIGTPEIDKLYEEALGTFDKAKQVELGNQIDKGIWGEVHSLTFYQVPDIVAAKEKLANFGAFGFASTIYEDIGFKK